MTSTKMESMAASSDHSSGVGLRPVSAAQAWKSGQVMGPTPMPEGMRRRISPNHPHRYSHHQGSVGRFSISSVAAMFFCRAPEIR